MFLRKIRMNTVLTSTHNNLERNKMKKKAVNKIRKSIKKCGLSKGGLVIDSNGSTTILGRFIIPLKSSD